MENTNLQRVLRTLTKAEWKSLGEFIASPYFNKNEKFNKFYQQLNPYFNEFSLDDPQKKVLFSTATGSPKFNDASYRNLCSDFLELVLEFLTYEYMTLENSNKQQFLTKALMDKQLYELTEKVFRKATVDLHKSDFDVMELLRSQIWMNDLTILLSIYTNRSRINASNEIMKADITYKVVTAWALVKIFNSLLNYMKGSKNMGNEPDANRIENFLLLYEQIQPFENPVVEMYYLLVKMTIRQDDPSFYSAKQLFNFHKDQLQQKNYENILIGLLDYANDKISNDEGWRKEVFELYELKLNAMMWHKNKDLSYASLYNAFMNVIQMKDLDHAEQMIVKNIKYLHPIVQAPIQHLCDAWIYFYKGDLDKSHSSLALVETENLLIKYELRTLQCLLFFEKKEWDVLGSNLESFRHFVLYNKSSVDPVVSKQFGNFCRHLSTLSKNGSYPTQKEKDKLRMQIQQDDHVYLRNWLLEKAGSQINI